MPSTAPRKRAFRWLDTAIEQQVGCRERLGKVAALLGDGYEDIGKALVQAARLSKIVEDAILLIRKRI